MVLFISIFQSMEKFTFYTEPRTTSSQCYITCNLHPPLYPEGNNLHTSFNDKLSLRHSTEVNFVDAGCDIHHRKYDHDHLTAFQI